MNRVECHSKEPRTVIHRRILDVADDMADTSLEEIAQEVSGASTEFVDRVLAEYGDPGEEPPQSDDGDDTGGGRPVDTEATDTELVTETQDGNRPRQGAVDLTETRRERSD